ncbi:unnamed protein product [Acanthoscelides obtectus]|nr:unnamed protein product [Acanthoscelides obtectus]CAK1663041.1 hypothetical protein AOBTE_LOCUS23448 [Acanthoscelides obtectus]
MVTFGTNQGPIVPRQRQPKSTAAQERSFTPKDPAPVSEERDDIPNPNQYQPLVPHQYRTKLYSLKPSPNLILGTPLDIKYSQGLNKYTFTKKDLAKSLKLGRDYNGPHIFEKQPYEFSLEKKTYLKPVKSAYFDQAVDRSDNVKVKYVPQIGIVYSAGVRYYVPQFFLYNVKPLRQPEDENSVYDVNDVKY